MTDRELLERLEWDLADLRREFAAQNHASSCEGVPFRIGRIVPDFFPSSSSSTTSTSTSTTTTPPACALRVWKFLFIDAQFPRVAGSKQLTTIERSQSAEFGATGLDVTLQVGDVVGIVRNNDRWWIVAKYGNCPQASSVTTTTTTTSSTTAP